MTDTKTALIAGGGIAGPVAAMALEKAGIEARVFEAHDHAADGIGGALSIAPNGLNALRVLGLDGVVEHIGTPIARMALQSWTGKTLGSFCTPAGLPDQQLVWREELYRALYDEASRRGVAIEHGKRLMSCEQDERGVTAHFADGSTASADILLGADGIRSSVRELVDPNAPRPRYVGLLGFGGWMPATGAASTRGEMRLAFGKRAFFGYQVNDDGSGGWFANLPREEPMTAAAARAVEGEEWLRLLRETFAGDRTPAREMLAAFRAEDLVVTGPLEDIPKVPVWSSGRMVLLGDAAHPTSPSSGQGASLAIESAVQLARCLRDMPYDEAFPAYEQLRRPRAERVIAAATRTNSDKAAGPVARVLRDLLMPLIMKLSTADHMAWQFNHTIDWQEPVPAGG